MSGGRVVFFNAATTSVSASPLVIANDGVASSIVTLTVRDSRGKPMAGLAAENCVLTVSGINNTVTQPTGVTDNEGRISGSFVSTGGATKVASWTVLGVPVTATVEVLVTADTFSLGAGPNAPSWTSKTTYPDELFETPIAVHPSGTNGPSGFRGYDGFDGYYSAVYEYTYTSYPIVSTPLGTKAILRGHFPGSRLSITAIEQATTPYLTGVRSASVQVTGTWSGTLSFETSTDGGSTWSAISGVGHHGGSTGTSTTVNGAWVFGSVANSRLRVRASSWTSGTAVVDVGCEGGAAPFRFTAGNFTGEPKKIYWRTMMRIDPNWSDNGNSGTKWVFFSQQEGNNHFVNLTSNGLTVFRPAVALQQTSSYSATGTDGPAYGEWMDVECIVIANTPGEANGVCKVWIDGVLHLDVANVPYFNSTSTARFTGLWCDPTYGGGRRPPKETINFDIAGWYRESAP